MSHVYVLVEHEDNVLNPVTGELITAARALGTVSAVVVGKQADAFDSELAALGAAQIVQATAEDYDKRIILPEVDALHALAAANPAPIVLAATPLYLLLDTAVVGRLGATSLAGLATGAVVLSTVTTQLTFLSYGTTARAARHFGAGRTTDAVYEGIQASWIALGVGTVLAVGLFLSLIHI